MCTATALYIYIIRLKPPNIEITRHAAYAGSRLLLRGPWLGWVWQGTSKQQSAARVGGSRVKGCSARPLPSKQPQLLHTPQRREYRANKLARYITPPQRSMSKVTEFPSILKLLRGAKAALSEAMGFLSVADLYGSLTRRGPVQERVSPPEGPAHRAGSSTASPTRVGCSSSSLR